MYQVEQMEVGRLQENTYLLINEQKEALIIDPGAQSDRLIEWIDSLKVRPIAILITHCHFDHVGAVNDIREHYQVEVYIPEAEEDLFIEYTADQMGHYRAPEHYWQHKGTYQIGNFEFEVRFVPGHSPAHVVYVFHDQALIFNGDTIFKGTIGRTDLPGGSYFDLIYYIGQEIIPLPENYRLYPGHGGTTTIDEELKTNPFFEVFRRKDMHNFSDQ